MKKVATEFKNSQNCAHFIIVFLFIKRYFRCANPWKEVSTTDLTTATSHFKG
jgi:hypothetical protein